ncbi:erythromycin esterase family protein [Jiangella endophytica]|uniref:erythromycin esterase family protein n=1 Tax=Jiangella endophytica TaxID=1623398 RepID=UPI000E34D460|nr:erythromycin esterase family protein [Jiangella endophytica]
MSIVDAPRLSTYVRHTPFALERRTARHLVEELGFRTVACDESWGSGVVLDRYVRGDGTDARSAVGQAGPRFRGRTMLDLVRWMREFNRGRADWDQVRFLGVGVLEPRVTQHVELHRFVAAVAPDRLPRAHELLTALALRGTPREHGAWYAHRLTEDERRPLVAAAREMHDLVRDLAASRAARRGRPVVDPDDAVLHAFALRGFYESGAAGGGTLRDRYVAGLITAWHERTGHRIVYSTGDATG